MINKELLETRLAELPLFLYAWIDPNELEFSDRIRWICEQECPMYGKSWACPPGVGEVSECRKKCLQHENCLMISTVAEVTDIANLEETLSTRKEHEAITNQVAAMMEEQSVTPFVLSSEACAICERCAILDDEPCRHPEIMHPCVEGHGINMIPTMEKYGLDFQYGSNVVTWLSLLFY